jgi:signal transduction histidine kinase
VNSSEHWQWEFLARLGEQLATTLDPDDAVRRLARCLVPDVALCCIVDLVEDDGGQRRVVSIAGDNEDSRRRERDLERYPASMDSDHPVALVLQIRKQVVINSWEDELLCSLAQDEHHLELLRALPVQSVVAVPIVARDRDVGVLSLFVGDERRLSDEQLPFVEEIASRAAFAIDNARLYRKLQEANAAKDEFLSLVSHELRTPLTTILGNAMTLQSRADKLDATMRREALNDIASESLRLQNIIDNLLFLARAEQGQLLERETQFVIHAVEKVVARHQRANPARRIETVQTSGMRPVTFPAGYLDQVVENLLSNAEKYTPIESPITVEVRRDQHEVTVTVADRGPGIPEDEIEHLFEPFYRAPGARRRAAGLGIGLAVCKRLVEAQGGQIWARNRPDGGAEFGFSLPVTA